MSDKEKREKLHKILDLIIDINGFEERKVEKTGDKPTVFFSFSGHVNGIDVQIFDNGWAPLRSPSYRCYTYFTESEFVDLSQVDELINRLVEFKNGMCQKFSTTECAQCGKDVAKDDALETVDGGICETCLEG